MLCRPRSCDTVSVNQIPCWDQQTIDENSVPVGYVKVAMRQNTVECAPRDLDRSTSHIPQCPPIDPHATNPFNWLGIARDRRDQIADPQVLDQVFALEG